jgi:hypothetical protein
MAAERSPLRHVMKKLPYLVAKPSKSWPDEAADIRQPAKSWLGPYRRKPSETVLVADVGLSDVEA